MSSASQPPPLRDTSFYSGIRLPLLLLGIGFALSGLGYWKLAKAEQEQLHLRFQRLAERLCLELQRRMNLPVYGLNGARGVFAADDKVDRKGFHVSVRSRTSLTAACEGEPS